MQNVISFNGKVSLPISYFEAMFNFPLILHMQWLININNLLSILFAFYYDYGLRQHRNLILSISKMKMSLILLHAFMKSLNICCSKFVVYRIPSYMTGFIQDTLSSSALGLVLGLLLGLAIAHVSKVILHTIWRSKWCQ